MIGNTNTSGSTFGALYADATGRLWGIDNVSGNVYLINAQNASTTIVAQVTPTNLNDGFSCRSSIINLNVIEETDTQSACDEYTWDDGNTYTADNAVANYSEVNILGCDSIVYNLDLTILNSSSSTDTQEECDEFTWIDGNTYTEGNNTAMFVIPNAVGCDSTITLNLTINNLTTLDAGTDQTVCEGADVILTATGAAVYDWEDGIQNGVSFSAELGSNTYTVEGTDANGCEDEQSVTITGAAYPELTFEVTDPACQGEASGNAVVVASNGTSPYNFVWNNGALEAENNGIGAGTYDVTVTDNLGCATQGSVVVIDPAESCFLIPGGLSPNGDGANETWEILGLSQYPDAIISVFDRWGQKVYTGDYASPPWDGTYEGKILPIADYYYILDLGNGETYNGVVTLKR
jgi:gliding motility-associated-like protein